MHTRLQRRTVALAVFGLAAPAALFAQAQFPLRTTPGSGVGFQHGHAVAGIGDITGDGVSEYLVGEPFDGLPGVPGSIGQGTAILFDGATGVVLQQDYGSFLVPQDQLGYALVGLGDVTGDGVRDFAAGAPQGNLVSPPRSGYVNIYSGAALTAPPALPVPLAVITQPALPAGYNPMAFGCSLANIGDVDFDGVDDLLVGAQDALAAAPATPGLGQVFVYSGATLPAGGTLIYALAGPGVQSWFGHCAAGLGDIDGDGAGDFVVGAPFDVPVPGVVGDGSIRVYSGATGADMGVKFAGVPGLAYNLGISVAAAGDVDGDGVGDILVGAPNVSSPLWPGEKDGQIYVLSGQAAAATGTAQVLLTINGYDGTNVNADARLGYDVASAGDVDSDGVPDLLAGAPGDHMIDPDSVLPPATWFGAPAAAGSGTARIYSGANGDLLKIFWGAEAAGAPALNPGPLAGLGASVASPGDLTGDGVPDVLAGEPGWSAGGLFPNLGKAHVYSGAYTFGNKYGVANPNSFGTVASISASGSLSVGANRLVLTVTNLPAGTLVIPFVAPLPDMVGTPVSNGIRYVDQGTAIRLPSVVAGPGPGGTATAVIPVNFGAVALGGAIQPFTEWYFQVQYRNPGAGAGVTNMSDAINLGFLP